MSAALDSLQRHFDPAEAPGDERLLEQRRLALADFLARGLPSTREEDWKYTSLSALEALELRPGPQPDAATAAALADRHTIADLPARRLVFVNGRFRAELSDTADDGDGVDVQPLAGATDDAPLGSVADFNRYRMAQLNQALFADGARIRTARGATAARPLYLLFLAIGENEGALVLPRVLIEAGEGSALTVVEHYTGEGGTTVTNALTEIVADAGALVTHHRVQEQAPTHLHLAALTARLARDARLDCHNVDVGGALVRNDVHVRLTGTGAEVRLNGLYFTVDAQHVDNHTRIDHDAPHTLSHEDYRGVLDGQSRAVFNGKVVVARDAQKIDAHQSNSNLMLSRRCEVDTKPELEIYADDVKCSHGATVGQIDADALFYLRSRGIDEAIARGLLTWGFANAVIGRIELDALRARLSQRVLGRLGDESLQEALA